MLEKFYDIEDDILIQRTITDQGKSSMKINNQPATLSFVRQIVSKMVDVHSQMDTYQLMDPNVQLDLLDRFALFSASSNAFSTSLENLKATVPVTLGILSISD